MARRVERPPVRRARDHPPSFSSSLLDAIYRSIDESDARGAPVPADRVATRSPYGSSAPRPGPVSGKPFTAPRHGHQHRDRWAAAPVIDKAVTPSSRGLKERLAGPVSERPVTAANRDARERRACAGWAPVSEYPVTRTRSRCRESTSSSSEASSCNGFSSSSSEPDSSGRPTRLRPVRTESTRPDPAVAEKKKARPGSARSRPKPPVSPGARLASFLNSLFAAAAGNPRKPRGSAPAAGPGKTEGVGKWSTVAAGGATATAAARGREARRRVEEMMRKEFARETEPREDDVASDASSDLFELEDLTVGGGRYRDELPVYGCTNLKADRGVSRRSKPL